VIKQHCSHAIFLRWLILRLCINFDPLGLLILITRLSSKSCLIDLNLFYTKLFPQLNRPFLKTVIPLMIISFWPMSYVVSFNEADRKKVMEV